MSRILKKSNLMAIASMCLATATLALMTTGFALASEKMINNSSDVDVDVEVGAADGSPEKEGKRVGPYEVRAGRSAKVVYGSDHSPYMHELLVTLDEPEAKAKNSQYRWITSPGESPSWDNTLNANSTLTIDAVGMFCVDGSNGDNVRPGSKRIVNNTKTDLEVMLLARDGSYTEVINIRKGETQVVQHGSASSPYLDGLLVQWEEGSIKAWSRQERVVTANGPAPTWDATLNTNNTLTITSVSAMKVTGSN